MGLDVLERVKKSHTVGDSEGDEAEEDEEADEFVHPVPNEHEQVEPGLWGENERT